MLIVLVVIISLGLVLALAGLVRGKWFREEMVAEVASLQERLNVKIAEAAEVSKKLAETGKDRDDLRSQVLELGKELAQRSPRWVWPVQFSEAEVLRRIKVGDRRRPRHGNERGHDVVRLSLRGLRPH